MFCEMFNILSHDEVDKMWSEFYHEIFDFHSGEDSGL
jgi:hypothetical protein